MACAAANTPHAHAGLVLMAPARPWQMLLQPAHPHHRQPSSRLHVQPGNHCHLDSSVSMAMAMLSLSIQLVTCSVA